MEQNAKNYKNIKPKIEQNVKNYKIKSTME